MFLVTNENMGLCLYMLAGIGHFPAKKNVQEQNFVYVLLTFFEKILFFI